jgi:hypothetical protein
VGGWWVGGLESKLSDQPWLSFSLALAKPNKNTKRSKRTKQTKHTKRTKWTK